MPTKKTTSKKPIDKAAAEIDRDLKRTIRVLEKTGFVEYMQYLRSPARIMWTCFLGGVFRGLGIIIGMTVVLALLVWFLGKIVDFPVIGQYFQDIKLLLEGFTNNQKFAK